MKEELLNLSEDRCPVDELLRYVRGHRCLDCGKCVFGYEGAAQLELTLADITMKKGRSGDLERLAGLCRLMAAQSLCEDGAALADTALADTALAVMDRYAGDFAAHAAKKSCRAGVCKRFVTYHILGKKKFVHVIDQDECTQCGKCLTACEEEAIVKAGAVKPRCPARPIPSKR